MPSGGIREATTGNFLGKFLALWKLFFIQFRSNELLKTWARGRLDTARKQETLSEDLGWTIGYSPGTMTPWEPIFQLTECFALLNRLQ